MNIVLPIFYAACLFGLFAKKMTPRLWAALAAWIAAVIVFRFFKS